MSTKFQDVASAALLNSGLYPQSVSASGTGPSIDLLQADGRCFAVQHVGALGGTAPTVTGKIEESSDGSTWSDVSGATFTVVSASNNVQIISFDRTKRYVRYNYALGGTSPTALLAAVIGEQKKLA